MLNRWVMVLFTCGMLLATSTTVTAQRWGQEPEPREGACFYEDPGYGGDYFCLRAGETLDSLPSRMNDRISSITGLRQHGGQGLPGLRVRGHLGAVRLRRLEPATAELGRSDFFRRGPGFIRWRSRSVARLRIHTAVPAGPRSARTGSCAARTRICSVASPIRRACGPTAAASSTTAGASRTFGTRFEGAPSTERRPPSTEDYGTTRERAQDIVRRAYLSVLNREPDPQSRGYVEKVLRDQWTQQDVERELRQSAEYRNRIR